MIDSPNALEKAVRNLEAVLDSFSDRPGIANGFAPFIGNWEFED
jgi:hypothetical protein